MKTGIFGSKKGGLMHFEGLGRLKKGAFSTLKRGNGGYFRSLDGKEGGRR